MLTLSLSLPTAFSSGWVERRSFPHFFPSSIKSVIVGNPQQTMGRNPQGGRAMFSDEQLSPPSLAPGTGVLDNSFPFQVQLYVTNYHSFIFSAFAICKFQLFRGGYHSSEQLTVRNSFHMIFSSLTATEKIPFPPHRG